MYETLVAVITFAVAAITGLLYNRQLKSQSGNISKNYSQKIARNLATKNNLPASPTAFFVGRQNEIRHILDLLSPNNPAHLIGIFGVGGIGKTALALQVANICMSTNLFENVVFVSAKQSVLTPDGEVNRKSGSNTLNEIILSIAYTLDYPDIIQATKSERFTLIRTALTRQFTLLIVDNLETADNSEEVIAFLSELPQQTKIIITSRRRYANPYITEIQLNSLSSQEGHELISLTAKTRAINLSDDEIRKIFDYTQGLPLAIMYMIARISIGFSVDTVLGQVKEPTNDFLSFILQSVMKEINEDSIRQLLMAIALLPDFSSRESISRTAGETDKTTLDKDIAKLFQLSLIEKQENKYRMHPLVRQYVINEFPEFSKFSSEAKSRIRIPESGTT